uniref:SAM-dependent methyltransferase n=1 Tax=Heterorhabditis bacteriophora TaxID=37862 RepID=A0A1I7WCF8_HETBA
MLNYWVILYYLAKYIEQNWYEDGYKSHAGILDLGPFVNIYKLYKTQLKVHLIESGLTTLDRAEVTVTSKHFNIALKKSRKDIVITFNYYNKCCYTIQTNKSKINVIIINISCTYDDCISYNLQLIHFVLMFNEKILIK